MEDIVCAANQSLLTATFQPDAPVNLQDQLYAAFVKVFKFYYGKQLRNKFLVFLLMSNSKKRTR